MKKLFFLALLMPWRLLSMACPACKKQQPGIFRGITHGVGPDSQWDYVIVAITLAIVLIALFYLVKRLIRPQEPQHWSIKNSIITQA